MEMINNPSLPLISRHEKDKLKKPQKGAKVALKRLDPALKVCRNSLSGTTAGSEDLVPYRYRLSLDYNSGFFFGTEQERSAQGKYIGKPSDEDGHILCVGESGRGKTQGLVIPTLRTWRGLQVILDVKGDIANHWRQLKRFSGKRLKVFHPGASVSLKYDPFAPLRHDGLDDLAGNALDLAKTLIPLKTEVPDPVWVQTAQNLLAGVIIYHFNLGSTFFDTMVDIYPIISLI